MEQKAWIIGEETVRKYLSAEDVIDIFEKTWRWYGEGKVVMPNKITTDMSGLGVAGWFNSMPAYIAPLDTAGLKVVGGYDANKELGLPYIKANVVVTDPRTGVLRALVSGDYINDVRTGAQPAIMVKLLAACTDVVCFIGTGLMAYYSLLCMSKTVTIKEVRLCDISEAAMDRFIAMSDYIQRTKLWEDVADQMIERIRSRRWEVGMKLPSEPEIAELFGVSRATVRSAIKLLQISGILRSRSGSGTYVADSAPAALETRELALVMSDPENLSSLVQTRYILEPQLAALSAQKASPSEVRRLFEIVSLMEQNQDRHNQVLFGFYQSVAKQMRGLRVLDSLTLEIFVEGIQEHKAIAKAIAEKDEALAKQLMRSHLRKDYGAYLERPEMLES